MKNFTIIYILCTMLFSVSCHDGEKPVSNKRAVINDTLIVIKGKKDNSDTLNRKDSLVSKLQCGELSAKASLHSPLTLVLTQLSSQTAPLILRVYQSKHRFLDRNDRHKEYTLIPNGEIDTIELDDIEYGEFALVVYQDENNNGRMDKSIIGRPTEPYALSNNYIPKFRIPTYNDCKFDYTCDKNVLRLKLIK